MREATIHIPRNEFEALGLSDLLTRLTAADVRAMSELSCDGNGCLLVVRLGESLEEASLSSLHGVEWWERLGHGREGPVYLFKVTVRDHAERFESLADLAVSNGDVSVREDGLEVSIVGEQAALARSVEEYAAGGVDVALRELSDYRGPADPTAALTARQREVVETAWAAGYFEVPREASAAAVAERLDLDPSTVTEHLRRAEANLLGEVLS
jgi:predicted DNA binding protein